MGLQQLRFIFCGIMVMTISQNISLGLTIGEAIDVTAARLEKNQTNKGNWPGEEDYTGSIVAGMVSAYERTCDPDYRTSAEKGGDYILKFGYGSGDELFALKRLSEISVDPCDNEWRTAAGIFFNHVKYDYEGGTDAYIDDLPGSFEPSTAVFYIANYAVSAYYFDAEDKQLWRNKLIEYLAEVDNGVAWYPVMGLGIATWTLA
ncbi:hypothetical protein ACFL1G_08645 [Planctomycetota bacterium]